ncbi:MAG: hypothetical protein F6J87_24700 [Spirulina sp. SIO3F2]|nr:hypothetical protein [Spirulina sp. SIO3F2]
MNLKPSIKYGIPVAILFFIVMGDQILPEPLKSASYNTRTAIVNYVGRTVFKPRQVNLNEGREQQLEDLENGQPSQ